MLHMRVKELNRRQGRSANTATPLRKIFDVNKKQDLEELKRMVHTPEYSARGKIIVRD